MRKDSAKIALLSATAILFTFSIVLSRITVYTLFLKKIGARELPVAYMEVALSTIFLSILFFSLIDRVRRSSLVLLTSISYMAFLLVAGILIEGGAPPEFLFYIFLFVTESVHTLLNILLWTISSDILYPFESKRYFPFISLLSSAGALGGGAFPHIFTSLEVEEYFYIIILVFSLIGVLSILLYRLTPSHFNQKGVDYIPLSKIRKGLRPFHSWRFLILIFILSFLVNFFDFNIDFIYNSQAKAKISPDSLPLFFGTVSVITNLVELALLLTVSRRIFSFFGIVTILLVFPLSAIPFLFLYSLSPSLTSGAILKVIDRISNYLFLNPAGSLFLQVFRRRARGRVNLLLNGLVKGLGIIAAGGFIYLVYPMGNGRAYPITLLLLLGFLVPFILYLKRAYVRTLIEGVRSSSLEIKRNSLQFLGEKFHVPLLRNVLLKRIIGEEDVLMGDLLMACGYSGDQGFAGLLEKFALSKNVHIRREAVRSLMNLKGPGVRDFLWKMMMEEKEATVLATIIITLARMAGPGGVEERIASMLDNRDPRVVANAVEAMGIMGMKGEAGRLLPFLDSPHSRLRANTMVALSRFGLLTREWKEALRRDLSSTDRTVVRSALYAAGESGHTEFIPLILPFIRAGDFSLRKNASLSLLKLGVKGMNKEIVDLLISGSEEEQRDLSGSIYLLNERLRQGIMEEIRQREPPVRRGIVSALERSRLFYREELEYMD